MYQEFQPNENLSRLLSTYAYLDVDNTHGDFFSPVIIHTSIVVTLKNNVEITSSNGKIIPPPVSIKGTFDAPFHFSFLHGEITSVIADFHPIGMYEYTGRSGKLFRNKFVNANEIWGEQELSELLKKLSASNSIEERINLFDNFLEAKAPAVLSEKSLIVEKATEIASKNKYLFTIKELTRELGVSESSLNRAFNKVLGTSPKQYFARALFEEILKQYTFEKQNTIDVLSESPFYDFSHINKWFKKFAHTAPSEFVNYDIGLIKKVLARGTIGPN